MNGDPSEPLEGAAFVDLLRRAAEESLPERTCQLLLARFGVFDGRAHTLEALGQVHCLSRERVRQLLNKGMRHISSRGKRELRQGKTGSSCARLVTYVYDAVRPDEPGDVERILAFIRHELPHLSLVTNGATLLGYLLGGKDGAARVQAAVKALLDVERRERRNGRSDEKGMEGIEAMGNEPVEKEREFARERFSIVRDRLEDPAGGIERIDRIQLEREYRLLGKVLDEVGEGRVLKALETWRRYLGGELAAFSRQVLPDIKQAHEAWWRLPPSRRDFVPEPPRPVVSTTVTDRNGYKWVIDDRFLLMLDGVIVRLRRWLESDE